MRKAYWRIKTQSPAAGNQSRARTAKRKTCVKEHCNAAASIEQTINDTLNKQSDKVSEDEKTTATHKEKFREFCKEFFIKHI